jgi:hypothetical protein
MEVVLSEAITFYSKDVSRTETGIARAAHLARISELADDGRVLDAAK